MTALERLARSHQPVPTDAVDALCAVGEATKDVAAALGALTEAIVRFIPPLVAYLVETLPGAISAAGLPYRWFHLAQHAKKARTRKKYKALIARRCKGVMP